jgi:hypothetical protein
MGIELGGFGDRPREVPPPPPRELPRPPSNDAPRLPERLREIPRLAPKTKPTEKPEQVKARTFKLTVGSAHEGGVTRQKITLDSKPREIVIKNARGVQIGDYNRQLNNYKYEVTQPQVKIDRLFNEKPGLERSFARLVENPKSVFANLDFRMRLSNKSVYSGGHIRRADTSSPQIHRFKASLDENGRAVFTECRGVQVGNCGTQRNNFEYQLVKPEVSLEAMLKHSPDLARSMATAAEQPDNQAVLRSFTGKIEELCGRGGMSVRELNLGHSHDSGVSVKGGDGVQGTGIGSVRRDRVSIDAGKVVLTGWNGVGNPEVQQARDAERDQRLQEGHLSAIAASRPHGSSVPPPGAAGMHAGQHTGELLNRAVERTAAATLRQVAPKREHLTKRMADEIKNALDSQWWSRGTEPGPEMPVGREHTKSRFGPGMNLSDASDRKRQSARVPYLELVSAAAMETRPDREKSTAPQAPSAHTTAFGAKAFGTAAPAVGAVLCGPAETIAEAMQSRRLNADVLLAYIRQRVWGTLYDGTSRSVVPAMRAVQALQLISFVDPSTSGGMWVVIDPDRQAPAASAYIDMDLSAGLPGRFRLLTHKPETSPMV